jgi:exodeoxyribonuclease-3
MRFISWNVNGLRAALKKGFMDTFLAFDADILALQETKLQDGQVTLELPRSYHQIWSYAERKGYSGTAVLAKEEPLRCVHKLGLTPASAVVAGGEDPSVLDTEGRMCALEFEHLWFVCVYVPNSQDGLRRIALRLAWGQALREFAAGLAAEKPVVICGDMNVAHQEIDLKNPKSNVGNAGFSDEEREDFTQLLDAGFIDTFRLLHPDEEGAYSWWSYRGQARANNTGWRIDYFLVSEALRDRVQAASIYPEVTGSDHCPVGLMLADW